MVVLVPSFCGSFLYAANFLEVCFICGECPSIMLFPWPMFLHRVSFWRAICLVISCLSKQCFLMLALSVTIVSWWVGRMWPASPSQGTYCLDLVQIWANLWPTRAGVSLPHPSPRVCGEDITSSSLLWLILCWGGRPCPKVVLGLPAWIPPPFSCITRKREKKSDRHFG